MNLVGCGAVSFNSTKLNDILFLLHPLQSADRNYLSIVKITNCKSRKEGSTHSFNGRPIRKETLVAVWNGRSMNTTVVEGGL